MIDFKVAAYHYLLLANFSICNLTISDIIQWVWFIQYLSNDQCIRRMEWLHNILSHLAIPNMIWDLDCIPNIGLPIMTSLVIVFPSVGVIWANLILVYSLGETSLICVQKFDPFSAYLWLRIIVLLNPHRHFLVVSKPSHGIFYRSYEGMTMLQWIASGLIQYDGPLCMTRSGQSELYLNKSHNKLPYIQCIAPLLPVCTLISCTMPWYCIYSSSLVTKWRNY